MTIYYAFKRAKNTLLYQEIKDQMPAEYIMEHYDTSLFPKGYFTVKNGWEIENEDYFRLELAKNPDIINTFKQSLHDLDIDQKNILKQKTMQELIENKAEYKLYLEFIEWKKKMGHQHYLKHIDRNY